MNLYFNDSVSTDGLWSTIANWWEDATGTIPHGALPVADDVLDLTSGYDLRVITVDVAVVLGVGSCAFGVTNAVSIAGGSWSGSITNNGIITSGNFTSVTNYNIVSGGTFDYLINQNAASVTNVVVNIQLGNFGNATSVISNPGAYTINFVSGVINSGSYSGLIDNQGNIYDGNFFGTVNNSTGTISGGNYTGPGLINTSIITGGNYSPTGVINYSDLFSSGLVVFTGLIPYMPVAGFSTYTPQLTVHGFPDILGTGLF